MTRQRRGFTLVELLVVVTIIAILLGLLFPAVNAARQRARTAQCMNNLHQLSLAVIQFETAKQKMPGYQSQMGTAASPIVVGWLPPLLGYIGRNDLYRQFQTSATVINSSLDIAVCPGDPSQPQLGGITVGLSYVVNGGRPDNTGSVPSDAKHNGVFFDQFYNASSNPNPVTTSLSYIAKKDGAAATVMLSENVNAEVWNSIGSVPPSTQTQLEQCFLWQDAPIPAATKSGYPDSGPIGAGINQDNQKISGKYSTIDYARPSSNHSGGVNVVFCDGHQMFLSEQIDPRIYFHIMTPDSATAVSFTTNVKNFNPPVGIFNEEALSK